MSARSIASLTAVLVLLTGCASIERRQTEHPGWTTVVAEPSSRKDWNATVVVPTSLPAHPRQDRYAGGDDDNHRYLLDTGDRLRIFVYGQPNLSRLYTVDHQGKVFIPLIGPVRARHRTIYQLSRAIRGRLGAKYVRDPQVTVDIHENRPFFILGEVRNAGQFPYVNGMTVQKAVAIAGGYTERASHRAVKVTRRVDGIEQIFEAPTNYVLKPGDTVYVRERFF